MSGYESGSTDFSSGGWSENGPRIKFPDISEEAREAFAEVTKEFDLSEVALREFGGLFDWCLYGLHPDHLDFDKWHSRMANDNSPVQSHINRDPCVESAFTDLLGGEPRRLSQNDQTVSVDQAKDDKDNFDKDGNSLWYWQHERFKGRKLGTFVGLLLNLRAADCGEIKQTDTHKKPRLKKLQESVNNVFREYFKEYDLMIPSSNELEEIEKAAQMVEGYEQRSSDEAPSSGASSSEMMFEGGKSSDEAGSKE